MKYRRAELAKEETIVENRPRIKPLVGGPDVKKAPEGSLVAMANAVNSKRKAGGKVSDNDKSLAARAKNELRRRRQLSNKTESKDPQITSWKGGTEKEWDDHLRKVRILGKKIKFITGKDREVVWTRRKGTIKKDSN